MLPQPYRLRRRADLSRLFRAGQKFVFRQAVVYYLPSGLENSRFAFSASRRVGGAVQRNRARRLLREAVRHLLDQAPQGYDFIFVARQETPTASIDEIKQCVHGLFEKLGQE